MMNKKILAIFLAAVAATLTGCGANTTSDSATEEKTTVAAEKETKSETKLATKPPAQPTTERKKQ